MIKIIKDCFNPIFTKHIQEALVHKPVYFYVEPGEDYEIRLRMVKIALKPYRKLQIISKLPSEYEEIVVDTKAEMELFLKGEFRVLNKGVKNFIVNNGLYFEKIVLNYCHGKRLKHVLSMTALACDIAKWHHVDVNKVYIAAMMHDVYKQHDKDDCLRLMEKYYPYHLDKDEALYHQYLGAYFIYHVTRIYDKDIYNAIYGHTTGECYSKIGMIIYIADKIDPSRGYDISRQLAVVKKNLSEGFKLVKKESLEYITKVEGKKLGVN